MQLDDVSGLAGHAASWHAVIRLLLQLQGLEPSLAAQSAVSAPACLPAVFSELRGIPQIGFAASFLLHSWLGLACCFLGRMAEGSQVADTPEETNSFG